MTKQLTQINSSNDTFQVWFNRTNDLLLAANNEFVTANTNANGSVSVGNTFLNGRFFANVLATSELRGGNVQASATLNITSNVNIVTGSSLTLGNSSVNIFANSTVLRIGGNEIGSFQSHTNVQTTGTVVQLVDSFLKANFRAAEYISTITDNAANNFQMTKTMVFHDSGSEAYITEYGTMFSNNHLGIFSANSNTTHVKVYFTPTVANSQVKSTRTTVSL